jgi:transposase
MSKTATAKTATANMSREAAETVTREIVESGASLAKFRTSFASAIKRAKDGNAHAALGFKSWTDYAADTFANMPNLGKGDREYLTAFMAGEGMSSRAVARVLGVSQSTAARMIRQAEESGTVAADREVTGKDGKSQTAKGKGKGRAKGKTAKGKGKGETATVTVKTAKTEELRTLALQILAELSDRWAEGDEAAEAAMSELSDAATVTV